jgi:putative aminopeptidase FrvX
MQQNFELLKSLCETHSPSGDEEAINQQVLAYIHQNFAGWKVKPEIIYGREFQHCILLVFGTPRTAIYAHMDNIGFTVRYGTQLVKIGGPRIKNGYKLTGRDRHGAIECLLRVDEANESLHYEYHREIEPGTSLSFACDFRETKDYIQSCYLDNRLGVYNALRVCETLENGVVVFSCWEEHGGGSVPFIAKYLWERFKIMQSLISDITWITEGVKHGKGVAVSLRDSGLPRKVFTDRIRSILDRRAISYQLEVESTGGSDGNELQRQPYPIDWCFVGAAEENVHTPDELVHKHDIESMITAYQALMEEL